VEILEVVSGSKPARLFVEHLAVLAASMDTTQVFEE
jgi:hypothetical protein